ncbi:CAP-Gly domain-containing linker protein 2-like [Pseudochaenichthys georgianus]|uniref:CAP-Gly domain-containing linker protein 2-like n=1 Tax=Pseudochaenichthys georgianus TaxID=52239 RepID=UPI0039C31FC7
MLFFSRQQTTVEEQSRIVQLEEELSLRRAEMANLQVKLRGSEEEDGGEAPGSEPETLVLRVQLASAGREHNKESSELREKHEAELEEGGRRSPS